MDRYEGSNTALTITMHGDLYIAIIMDRYEDPLTAVHVGLFLAIKLARYIGS
jgi:hypothetical protein